MRPAQILFLQGTAGFGGSKRSLLTLIQLLHGSPFAAAVACPDEGWFTHQLQERQIPRVRLPFPAWRKWLQRPFVASTIRHRWLPALREQTIALVHSNEFWWGPQAILLARQLGVPAVVHLRDGHHTLRKAHQYRLHQADAILAVSTELREQFAADPLLYQRTHLLHNGIDPATVESPHLSRAKAREQFGLRPAEFVVGNVGQLCARKNQPLLLRALGQMPKAHRPASLRVLLAGDADPGWAETLATLAESLSLKVDLLGHIDDMPTFYAALDLLVHCATREGLPRVVIEAMAAGKPVVATTAEGIQDAIPDAQHGWHVPAEHETRLGEAIAEAAADPHCTELIAAQGQRRARTVFGIQAQRERLLELYSQLTHIRCDSP